MLILALFWSDRRGTPINPLLLIIILELVALLMRLGLTPRTAASVFDILCWSFVRDGVWLIPAGGLALLALRWTLCRWLCVALMVLHLLLIIISAGIVRELSRPLDLDLILTAFAGPDVARMSLDGALIGFLLVILACIIIGIAAATLRLGRLRRLSVIVVAGLLMLAAGIHEPLRRQALAADIGIHLDATNSFSPLYLTLWSLNPPWRKQRHDAAPQWSETARETLRTWGPAELMPPVKDGFADLVGRYRGMNVLIMLMESYRAEAVGVFSTTPTQISDTPEFDSLSREGWLFTSYVATGQYSGNALWSIYTGLPFAYPWHPLHRDNHIASKRFSAWQWPGYQHLMICATDPRFDNYLQFTKTMGWNYVQVPPIEPVGGYGTHDEAALPWAVDHLANQVGPWVGVVFSVSNHWPFHVPGRDPRRPFRSGIRYSDRALGRTLERFRKDRPDVAKRTVIVVVGDHGVRQELSVPPGTMDPIFQPAANRVPCLIILPDGRLAGERCEELCSHMDLQPLLADFCDQSPPFHGLGTSPLRGSSTRWAATGVADAATPGILLWRDERCDFVTIDTDTVVPLLTFDQQSPRRSWWVSGGERVKDDAARDLLRSLRALYESQDLRWRPDTNPNDAR